MGKRTFTIIVIILILLSFISHSDAQWQRAICLGIGLYASYMTYEAGHAIVNSFQDKKEHDRFLSIEYPSPILEILLKDKKFYTKRRGWEVQMSGLGAQMVSSEIILLSDDYQENDLLIGFLMGNIVNEITYPVLRGNSQDFSGNWGKDRKRFFRSLFVGHGLFALYRVFKNDHKIQTNSGIHLTCSKNFVGIGFKKNF